MDGPVRIIPYIDRVVTLHPVQDVSKRRIKEKHLTIGRESGIAALYPTSKPAEFSWPQIVEYWPVRKLAHGRRVGISDTIAVSGRFGKQFSEVPVFPEMWRKKQLI
jgi:hypothetical protein